VFKRIIDAVIPEEPNLIALRLIPAEISKQAPWGAEGFHNVDTDDGIKTFEGQGATNRTTFKPRVIRGDFRVNIAIQDQRGLRRFVRVF